VFSDVIGHKEAVEKLKNAMRSGRIANAYIFSGPAGIGKEFVAINFAKALNCLSRAAEYEKAESNGEDSCDECISCRRIDDGNHADVMLIRPEGTRLKIDQVRFLQRQGAYRAIEGSYKVYIIAEAEKMTAEAANSLLKTLEEPPGAMVLILLTSVYSALLPTIRSRCQSLKFSLVPTAVLRDELMKRFGLPESKAKWVALRSQGRVGSALMLAREEEEPSSLESRVLSLESGKESWVLSRRGEEALLSIFRKAESLSEAQDSLDALLSWYRDLLLVRQGCPQDMLIHSDRKGDLERIAGFYSDVQIEKSIKVILKTQNLPPLQLIIVP
jgi:DNA polymerase-3 subunit delta'